MYVYQRTEPFLFTVGYYKPDGTWEPESDHATREEAARRVIDMNGAAPDRQIGYASLSCAFDHIGEALDDYDDDKIGVAEFISRIREQVGERAPGGEGVDKFDFEAYKQGVIAATPPKKFITFNE